MSGVMLYWPLEFALEVYGAWLCFFGGAIDGKVIAGTFVKSALGASRQSVVWGGGSGVHEFRETIVSVPNTPSALLGSLLAFLAISDIPKAYLLLSHRAAYWKADWTQTAVLYAMLGLLACQLIGKLLDAQWGRIAGLLSLLGGLLLARTFNEPLLANRLLDSEIAACMILGIGLYLAQLSPPRRLSERDTWLSRGVLVYLLGASLAAMLRGYGDFHWIGESAALGTFIWAMRKEPEAEQVIRPSLGWVVEPEYEVQEENVANWN